MEEIYERLNKIEAILWHNNLSIKDQCKECNNILHLKCYICDITLCETCNNVADNKYMKFKHHYICEKCKIHDNHLINPFKCEICKNFKCKDCDLTSCNLNSICDGCWYTTLGEK